MKIKHTQRGFARVEFKDGNGVSCSLQKSSAAEREHIWLGANTIGMKKFIPGDGWEDCPGFDDKDAAIIYQANTRMHLTRRQVKALLPHLQAFVDNGDITP